jgi:branched-chain amino acid transport system substrate-binding protein
MRGRLVIAAILAIALAGCSGGGDPAATTSAAAPPPPAPPTTTVKVVSMLSENSFDEETTSMLQAIALYLDGIDHRIGDVGIEYANVDTHWTRTQPAGFDVGCTMAADKIVADEAVVGVVGPLISGCARRVIPDFNKLPLALVSPSNQAPGLTHEAPGTAVGEPGKYYPNGIINYARVVPADDVQGRFGARYLQGLGATSVCVLDDGSDYGRSITDAFMDEAHAIALGIACRRPRREDEPPEEMIQRAGLAGADAIYIGGVWEGAGNRLVRARADVLGPDVRVLVSDGFLDGELPKDAEGIYKTTPYLPPAQLPDQKFVQTYTDRYGAAPGAYAAYAVAALQALLDAIARSDHSRAGVAEKLLQANVQETPIGPVSFDRYGDRVSPPVGVFQVQQGAWTFLEAGT